MTVELPAPRFDPFRRMTDRLGLFEHAADDRPNRRHGYCTDDAARAALLACQAREDADPLTEQYLNFVVSAVSADGRCHNRLSPSGVWTDEPGLGD